MADSSASGAYGAGAGQGGMAYMPGMSKRSSKQSGDGQGSGDGSASGGSASGGSTSGSQGSNKSDSKDSKHAKSKRSNRPTNWGLPGSRGHVTAITRPIHVAVQADRVMIVPDRGDDRSMQQFPISPQLSPQEVDAFVTGVQREMKSWGLAVENGYWKPQLMIDVAPNAEGQFQQLQTALEGSGFDLQRKVR